MVHVAVIGAGPVGIDAALAAHERGWDVVVYERASRVAGNVRDWAHVRMFTPWAIDVSPRMVAAVAAPPGGCPSGADFADYLDRVAGRLPAGAVRLGTTVEAVGREGLLKSDEIGTGERDRRCFRLLVRAGDGAEVIEHADVVVDCSGTWHNPAPLGAAGIPAPGERSCDVVRRIPEVDGSWAGRRVLLAGAGKSAQTAARALAGAGADLTWAVRSLAPTWGAVDDDPLPDRAALVTSSQAIDRAGHVRKGVTVQALAAVGEGVQVDLAGADGATTRIVVDRVVSLVGASPDAGIYRQLQVHECYATEGPMSLAATLLGSAGGDCLAQVSPGVDSLRNPEPQFFVLGSKSYGRTSTFLLRVGYDQVDAVFASLADELSPQA
ncbi:MAG TPA: NAD(P)-binding protein [Acidimicrobiales bacterium]|nr:NAD(P)-binding protein [Acidimicrobiales bacterium]